MSMKKSLLNKGLVLNDIKRFWWAMVVYCIGIIFFEVLPMSSLAGQKDLSLGEINNCLFDSSLYIIIIGGAVGISILVFSFMNRKASNEFMYSLPFTKKTIFFSKYIAGLIMILIPFALAYSILLIVMGVNGLYIIVNIMYVIKAIFLFMLLSLLAYTITVAIGIFTSSSIATGIFFLVFILLPSGFKVIADATLSLWIYGYQRSPFGPTNLYVKVMDILNPISNQRIISLRNLDVDYYLNYGLLINLLLCIIGYLIISYLLFNCRKSESVGNMIVFKWFKPILKYGFTLCIMLTSLLFLVDGYGDSSFGYKIGVYLITSAISYYFVTCFMEKSISAVFEKKYIKGLLMYTSFVLVIFSGIWFNIFGIQNSKMNIDDIKYIRFDVDLIGEIRDMTIETNNEYLIDEILKFKEYIVENRNKYKIGPSNPNMIRLYVYEKDGGQYEKVYYVDERLLNHNSLENLYLSEENKKEIYGGIQDVQDVNYITLRKGVNIYVDDIKKKIIDRDIIEELILAIKEDVKGFNMEEIINTKVIGTIRVSAEVDHKQIINGDIVYPEKINRMTNIVITESYKNTIQKMKDNNIYKDIVVAEEDIEEIIIENPANGHRYEVIDKKRFIDQGLQRHFEKEYVNPYYYDYESTYLVTLKFRKSTDDVRLKLDKKLIPEEILKKTGDK